MYCKVVYVNKVKYHLTWLFLQVYICTVYVVVAYFKADEPAKCVLVLDGLVCVSGEGITI